MERTLRARYDHLTFPGAVPRTFVGPVALAAAAWPGARLVEGMNRQILGRWGAGEKTVASGLGELGEERGIGSIGMRRDC